MEELKYSSQMGQSSPNPSELASRLDRLLAKFLDNLAIIAVWVSTVFLGGVLDDSGNLMVVLFVSGLLGLLIYQAFLLTTRGQTVGKIAMKIRIVRVDAGENGGFKTNFLLRSVLNFIIAFCIPFYGLVDTLLIFTESKRCIHDRLAGTKVIKAYGNY